ncbi:E3 ubiquitin-protein ligase synoviolin B [Linum grandiflorum]
MSLQQFLDYVAAEQAGDEVMALDAPIPPPRPPRGPFRTAAAWRYRRRLRDASYEIRNNGAPQSAIEKLERVEFDGGLEHDDCCAICLEEMDSGEGKVIRLDCRHLFHEICLVSWIRRSNCCPLCRFRILDS